MEKNFDFKTVGKRMPYVMPEGFLTDMENRVMESLRRRPPQEASAASTICSAAWWQRQQWQHSS